MKTLIFFVFLTIGATANQIDGINNSGISARMQKRLKVILKGIETSSKTQFTDELLPLLKKVDVLIQQCNSYLKSNGKDIIWKDCMDEKTQAEQELSQKKIELIKFFGRSDIKKKYISRIEWLKEYRKQRVNMIVLLAHYRDEVALDKYLQDPDSIETYRKEIKASWDNFNKLKEEYALRARSSFEAQMNKLVLISKDEKNSTRSLEYIKRIETGIKQFKKWGIEFVEDYVQDLNQIKGFLQEIMDSPNAEVNDTEIAKHSIDSVNHKIENIKRIDVDEYIKGLSLLPEKENSTSSEPLKVKSQDVSFLNSTSGTASGFSRDGVLVL